MVEDDAVIAFHNSNILIDAVWNVETFLGFIGKRYRGLLPAVEPSTPSRSEKWSSRRARRSRPDSLDPETFYKASKEYLLKAALRAATARASAAQAPQKAAAPVPAAPAARKEANGASPAPAPRAGEKAANRPAPAKARPAPAKAAVPPSAPKPQSATKRAAPQPKKRGPWSSSRRAAKRFLRMIGFAGRDAAQK